MNTPIQTIQAKNTAAAHGRKGKVARLRREIRDQINRMLDDGFPYHLIIKQLGEAGAHLNVMNISNWKRGGYQNHAKAEEILHQNRIKMELAAELVRETTETTSQQAAVLKVGALQMIDALVHYGDESLRNMLQINPTNFIRLLEAMPQQAQAAILCDRQRAQTMANSNETAKK